LIDFALGSLQTALGLALWPLCATLTHWSNLALKPTLHLEGQQNVGGRNGLTS
jgi:hypothetical protein